MLHPGFRRPVADDVRAAFVIAPHHPDRLRRPLPAGSAAGDDSFRHALTWNVSARWS